MTRKRRTIVRNVLVGLLGIAATVFVLANFSTIRTKLSGQNDFTDIPTFAHCVSAKAWTPFQSLNRMGWRETRVSAATVKGDDFVSIWNYLGWHITWSVLIDLRGTPPVAYETYDPNSGIRVLFRGDVPASVKTAIQACGMEFGGTLPEDVTDAYKALAEEEERIAIK